MNPTEFPGARAWATAIFAVSVVALLAGALIAVATHRIIRSVCGLALCCIGLAGLYVFLGSPFLALMQILIYVGAVCITIVFAVMLAEPDEPEPSRAEKAASSALWLPGAMLASAAAGGGLAWVAVHGGWTTPSTRATDGSLRAIGIALLTTHSLAFEVISAVLLVAIVGALAIAHGGRGPVK